MHFYRFSILLFICELAGGFAISPDVESSSFARERRRCEFEEGWQQRSLLQKERRKEALAPDSAIKLARKRLESFLASKGNHPTAPSPGRGIVTCSGGKTYTLNLVVMLRSLRSHLKCTLPVEVFYWGSLDLDPSSAWHLAHTPERFGSVRTIDAAALPVPPHRQSPPQEDAENNPMRGFSLKVYALLHTRFTEVLFLDADNSPVLDPTFLFDDPTYASTGCLFWPDALPLGADQYIDPANAYRFFAGLEPPLNLSSLQAVDSGQFVVHTVRHAAALEWAWFLNSRPDIRDIFLDGDKDCFRIAFAAAGETFALVDVPIRAGMIPWREVVIPTILEGYSGSGWRMVAMIQGHPSTGEPLFVHRTQSKLNFVTGFQELHYISSPLSRLFMLCEFGSERSRPGYSFRQAAFIDGVNYTVATSLVESSPYTSVLETPPSSPRGGTSSGTPDTEEAATVMLDEGGGTLRNNDEVDESFDCACRPRKVERATLWPLERFTKLAQHQRIFLYAFEEVHRHIVEGRLSFFASMPANSRYDHFMDSLDSTHMHGDVNVG